jgi:hypothetical protein
MKIPCVLNDRVHRVLPITHHPSLITHHAFGEAAPAAFAFWFFSFFSRLAITASCFLFLFFLRLVVSILE